MGLQIERKQHEPQLEHGNLCLIDYQHLCVRERLCVCVSHTNIHSSYSHSHYTPTNHSTPMMHINSCAYLERTRTCMHGCTHARMRAHTPSHTNANSGHSHLQPHHGAEALNCVKTHACFRHRQNHFVIARLPLSDRKFGRENGDEASWRQIRLYGSQLPRHPPHHKHQLPLVWPAKRGTL